MQETQEMWNQSLGREEPLEEGIETHSSILAWEIPWTEEPGRLQSMGLQRVRRNWSDFSMHACISIKFLQTILGWYPHVTDRNLRLQEGILLWSGGARIWTWAGDFHSPPTKPPSTLLHASQAPATLTILTFSNVVQPIYSSIFAHSVPSTGNSHPVFSR